MAWRARGLGVVMGGRENTADIEFMEQLAGRIDAIALAASRISITTKEGRSSLARLIASSALAAVPTTSNRRRSPISADAHPGRRDDS